MKKPDAQSVRLRKNIMYTDIAPCARKFTGINSVIRLFVFARNVDLTFLGHNIRSKILIVCADLVDQRAVRQEFHNAVSCRLHDLMIVGCEQDT